MVDKGTSYSQPTKEKARRRALRRALTLLTTSRDEAALVPAKHVRRVRRALLLSKTPGYAAAARGCDKDDVRSWERFRARAVGTREPGDLTVAYLAGPEPTNDLDVLVELGVRPENIWAFEAEKGSFARGLTSLQERRLRGVKLIPISIGDYFAGTSRRFDIIYLDACGALPSRDKHTGQVLANLFRYSALAPLGVLVTNFARPDPSETEKLDPYVHYIANYLFPKSFLDSEEGGMGDSAGACGFTMTREDEADKFFPDEVRKSFDHYYGAFITRHIIDLASLVAPMMRLANSRLYPILFAADAKTAATRSARYLRFADWVFDDGSSAEAPGDGSTGEEADLATTASLDGEAVMDPSEYSLLWTLAACGALTGGADFEATSIERRSHFEAWIQQWGGTPQFQGGVPTLMAAYYALRHDVVFWSEPMKRVADFPFQEAMPAFCDAPNRELGFFPAFAQLAYPTHCNIRVARRYRYTAEERSTPMYLDVLAFDECRYVYDWLSAAHLVPEDWNDVSAQLTFRFALDGIAKDGRWYGDDFLTGCHAVGIDSQFPASELKARLEIRSKTRCKRA